MSAAAETTRIFVRNLPKHLTDDRFRQHFAAKGKVTDAKVLRTADGSSRRIGFIGFRTAEEADAAAAYFNNTFIDTSRVTVERALAFGDRSLPRPWSRYSEGSSAWKRGQEDATGDGEGSDGAETLTAKEAKRKAQARKQAAEESNDMVRKLKEAKTNEEFQEYLTAMTGRGQAKLWANDDKKADKDKPAAADGASRKRAADDDDSESSGEYQELKADADDEEDEEGDDDASSDSAKALAKDKAVSDMDYLKSKITSFSDDEDDEDDDDAEDARKGQVSRTAMAKRKRGPLKFGSDDEGSDEDKSAASGSSGSSSSSSSSAEAEAANEPEPEAVPTSKYGNSDGVEPIAESGRLFVRNLSYQVTDDDITNLFQQYGDLSEVHLPIDSETKQPKGFALIQFLIPEHAVAAHADLDGQIFQGRLLHILPAKAAPTVEFDASMSNEKSAYKKQKEAERRKAAGNDAAWNSLFLRSDTVAEAVAKKLNVDKRDVLDPNAKSMAVRMALGETYIIAETKETLKAANISLEALGDVKKKKKRSKTAVLVKNLPHDTDETELRAMFEKYGTLDNFVLPPTRALAVVQFAAPTEAKVAFRALAYRKYKGVPIYLEWAPMGIFGDSAKSVVRVDGAETDGKAAAAADAPVPPAADAPAAADDADEIDGDGVGCSLYVKNLNFETKEKTLKRAFADASGLRSAKLMTKPDPKNAGKRLSMGYAFLEFRTAEQANKAMKKLQGTVVDGHALQLKVSSRAAATGKPVDTAKTGGNKAPTKIFVRNVPFEAKSGEIQDLFGSFGQLKRVRMPKKMDRSKRGFAFVEFVTHEEAKNAFDALANTHLYGRHLVLEWAKNDETVEELREKTQRQFGETVDPRQKRRKIDM